jgi:hypothetical protein
MADDRHALIARQWNLNPGEVYMIQRTFNNHEGKPVVYYQYERDVCSWFQSYDAALDYVMKADLLYGTWRIVKMVPIPRELDGLEVITFKGQPADD